MSHRGVAVDDPRNAGPIEFFRPKAVTRESLRLRFTAILGDKHPADVESRIEQTMHTISRGPIAPDQPVSQSLSAVANPWLSLGTHPDIVEALWHLDDDLPQRCRWVFWGGPSLVQPDTGVVFAVGIGTIGIVFRLPPRVIASADPQVATVIQKFNGVPTFDIGPAGPEWRLIRHAAPPHLWCRAAYESAGEPE